MEVVRYYESIPFNVTFCFFYSIKIFHWLFLFELLLDSPTELIQLTDSLSEYFLYICFLPGSVRVVVMQC